jgi:hypothetical protein
MKKFASVALIAVVGMAFCVDYAIAKRPEGKGKDREKINAASRLAPAGDVKGNVGCNTLENAPEDGYLVYIPGTSFIERTDSHGDFRLYNVPAGSYELYIEPANQLVPMAPTTGAIVEVVPRRVVTVGPYDVCLQ